MCNMYTCYHNILTCYYQYIGTCSMMLLKTNSSSLYGLRRRVFIFEGSLYCAAYHLVFVHFFIYVGFTGISDVVAQIAEMADMFQCFIVQNEFHCLYFGPLRS